MGGALALVTGATGFVGRAVCGELLRQGWRVRAALRDGGRAAPAGCEGCVVGDLAARPDWTRALAGAQAAVHLAARVHDLGSAGNDAAYMAVNSTATEELARAAARAGVARLVFLSSIKVNGERNPPHAPLRASDVPAPEDAYARSKWAAEKALAVVARETGLQTVVIRSPLVYGPEVGANFRRLMRLVESQLPLPFGSIRNRRSLLYVGNLAALVATCLNSEKAAGQTVLPSDGEDVSTPQLVERVAAALGVKARLLPCPVVLLRAAAAALGRQAEAARLIDSLFVDPAATARAIDWHPAFTLAQGLAETATWYRRSKAPA